MRLFVPIRKSKNRTWLHLDRLEDRSLPTALVTPVFSPPVAVALNAGAPDIGVAGTGPYAGTFDVVYQRDAGSLSAIVVKRFNADGTPLPIALGASEIAVDSSNVSNPTQHIAVRADGSFVVVYRQSSGVAGIETIAARIYNPDGSLRQALPSLVTTDVGVHDATDPAVAVQDATGNITVTWIQNDRSAGSRMSLRRIDANGNFLSPGDQTIYRIPPAPQCVDVCPIIYPTSAGMIRTPLGPGQLDTVIAMSNGPDPSTPGIYFIRLDNAGNALDATLQKANATGTSVGEPKVGIDAAGDFVVAWKDNGPSGGNGNAIKMRRFDSTGNALSPNDNDELVDSNPNRSKLDLSVARADDGRFLVAFSEIESQSGQPNSLPTAQTYVSFREYSKEGNLVGNKTTLGMFLNVEVFQSPSFSAAVSGSGIFGLTWAGNTGGIRAQTFREQPPPFFAVNTAPDQLTLYRSSNGTAIGSFAPFANYNGGLSFAWGDVKGGGEMDLVVGATSGNPAIKLYDGAKIQQNLAQFLSNPDSDLIAQGFVYDLNQNIGINVAVGDVEGTGYADIVTAPTAGNPHIKVFSGKLVTSIGFVPAPRPPCVDALPPHACLPTGGPSSVVAEGFAYALGANIGVNLAVTDMDGDGYADIITAPTAGNPHVKIFSGKQIIAGGPAKPFGPDDPSLLLASFFAYATGANVGAFVAAADVDGDGVPDIITGAAAGNPEVRVFRGADLRSRRFDAGHPDASLLDRFFAFEQGRNLGVSVGAADLDGDGRADILAASVNRTPAAFKPFKTNPDNTHTRPPDGYPPFPPDLPNAVNPQEVLAQSRGGPPKGGPLFYPSAAALCPEQCGRNL